MALFKISKGVKSNLPKTYNEGWCYVTTDENKMYIDYSGTGGTTGSRVCLNAEAADRLKKAVNINVNLASNATASFDGSAGISPGVTGILKIANGGTNANTNHGGYTNLINQGSLVNANTNLNRGLYTWSTSSLNVPRENSYGGLYNFIANTNRTAGASIGSSVSDSWVWQVAFDTGNTTPYIRNSINASEFSPWVKLASISDIDSRMGTYLPLSAGESKKLTGALGLTKNVMYGTTLPSSGFDGQLFFLEDDGATLPTGGNTGYALVKNSNADGDAAWKSSQITWAAGTSNGPKPKIFNIEGTAIPAASASASGIVTTGEQTFAGVKTMSRLVLTSTTDAVVGSYAAVALTVGPSSSAHIEIDTNEIMAKSSASASAPLYLNDGGGYVYLGAGSKVYSTGSVLYGAAWNDYAEYRTQKEVVEPGYCVASSNNGQVYKTTEKFQACDGIVSDTFGFAIGETDECKTPLAVAGRVLAYCSGNRYDYQSGDTVCAGPEGKVIKMTREEIKEYPDRIIGIVSEIPEYETWGTGNVPVNGRIWIKIK